MSAEDFTEFCKYFYTRLRFSGYQFYTWKIAKNGQVSSKFKPVDFIIFIISAGLTFNFTFFFGFKTDFTSMLNSGLMQQIVDYNTQCFLVTVMLLKIFSFCNNATLEKIFNQLNYFRCFVSICARFNIR